MRPLYKAAANATSTESGNAGLWYDKFCNQWCLNSDSECVGLKKWTLQAFQKKEGGQTKTINPKLNWIDDVAGIPLGSTLLLSEAVDRQVGLLSTYGQTPLFFKTDWYFVTGLGREHPVENGFAWHHGWGMPYLPGSSVKGMVRAWVEYWLEGEINSDEVKRIFGPRGEAALKSPNCGSVIFLDALPTKPVKVKADIMTPHYGPYYQTPSDQPPADWHSPTPIPFLVVTPDTTFQFGLLPRRPGDEGDVEQARVWLEQALDIIGAGAKTAVGYGRMRNDPNAKMEYQQRLRAIEQQIREQKEHDEEASMTPEQRRIKELKKLFEHPAVRTDNVRKQQMKDNAAQVLKDAGKWTSPTDQHSAANLIEAIYDGFGWGNDATKQKRKASIAQLREPHPE